MGEQEIVNIVKKFVNIYFHEKCFLNLSGKKTQVSFLNSL